MLKLIRDTPRRREGPALRCKPGDLAMVTRSIDHYGRDRNMLGMVFRLIAIEPAPVQQHPCGDGFRWQSKPLGNPCWTYEGPLKETTCDGNTWRIDSVADACLTPLLGGAGTFEERSASEPEHTSAKVAVTERATVHA